MIQIGIVKQILIFLIVLETDLLFEIVFEEVEYPSCSHKTGIHFCGHSKARMFLFSGSRA